MKHKRPKPCVPCMRIGRQGRLPIGRAAASMMAGRVIIAMAASLAVVLPAADGLLGSLESRKPHALPACKATAFCTPGTWLPSVESSQSCGRASILLGRTIVDRLGSAPGGRRRLQAMPVRTIALESGELQGNRKALGVESLVPLSRQQFQDACLPRLIRVGQSVPDTWAQGVHFSSPAGDLNKGEYAILLGQDGSRRFCRIDSVTALTTADEDEALLEGSSRQTVADIKAEVGRREGTQVMRVQVSRLAKVLPLQLSDIQRLAAVHSEMAEEPGQGEERGGEVQEVGVLMGLRRLMDVDKKTSVDMLPFQPKLSARTSSRDRSLPPSPAPSRSSSPSPRSPSRSDSMAPASSDRWGELNGWWTDEARNKELFEIELVAPFGFSVAEVAGEGTVVLSLDQGGNAQRAGMRVSDLVSISGLGFFASKATDVQDILSLVSSKTSTSLRIRYERETKLMTNLMAPAGRGYNKPPLASKKVSAKAGTGGSKAGVGGARELEFEVEKPVGIMLIEIPGYGVFVQRVTPGSNAEASGIKVGDRVVSTSSPLSYDAGTTFDRGTTYTSVSKPGGAMAGSNGRGEGSSSVTTVLSAVADMDNRIVIGVVRDKSGQSLVDMADSQGASSTSTGVPLRGSVDVSLTEKVRGALLDEEERDNGAKGRPLKVNLDMLNFNARRARERGQSDKALAMLSKAIRMDPYDGRAWLATAKHYERQKNYSAARDWLNKGLKFSPSNPFLLQSLGVLEERTGDLVAARALYVKASKMDPSHAPSWVSLGKLEERTKRQERARECYRAATRADGKSYYAWQCWAVLESRLGNTQEARRLFEICSQINPENAAVWQAWGVMESRLRNYGVAVQCFERGLEVSPRNTFVLQAWAVLEWKRDDLVRANELFERAITTRPDDGGVYQAYAMLLKDRKLWSSARAMLRRGTEQCREHLALWQAWALMEAELGNVKQAREIFQQGIWDSGGSEKAHMIWQAWGLLEAKMGDMDLARCYLSRAVEGASRPAACYVAWSRLEELEGDFVSARRLFEEAVAAEPFNEKLWTAYEGFEKRVSGETSVRASELYERRVVAEMRSRGGVGSIGEDRASQGGPSADDVRQDSQDAMDEVDGFMKAKWTTPRRGASTLNTILGGDGLA